MSAEPQADRKTLTDEEAVELFDRLAREYLGVSGEEFLRGLDAGTYDGRDEPGVVDLLLLLPLAR